MERSPLRIILIALASLLLATAPLLAQASSGVITGSIEDETGGAIPGTTVTVTNDDTGLSWTAVTDDSGVYRLPRLPLGTYTIVVEQPGFKQGVQEGVVLTVAQQVTANIVLQIGEISEQVIVQGTAVLLESKTSAMSGLVDEQQMEELPLNGRDFYQLAYLQPGATQVVMGGSNPWTNGEPGTGIMKLALNGMRPSMSNALMDGTDINEPTYNVPPGGVAGALGVEAIKEFRVLTNNYSAEYGRNAGGIVTTATKSGTNELHGSLYFFHRNDNFDAPNYFEPGDKPEFRRNQFGVSLGGPIVKDKTFFFFNYEGLRELKQITANTPVPDDFARRGLLEDPDNQGQYIDVGVDPRVVPFMNLFPVANSTELGGGIALWSGAQPRDSYNDYVMGRIDHSFDEDNRIFARYTFDDSEAIKPFQGTLTPGFPALADRFSHYFTAEYQKIISPTLINEARFGFNRSSIFNLPAQEHPQTLTCIPQDDAGNPLPCDFGFGLLMGTVRVGGYNAIGNFTVIGGPSNTFQYQDTLIHSVGKHSLKYGVDARRMQNNGLFGTRWGFYGFDNIEAFLKAEPRSFGNGFVPAVDDPVQNPQNQSSLSDTARGYRQTQINFFIQDDIQINSDFTLNLGFRWELNLPPTESNGRLANIRNLGYLDQSLGRYVPVDTTTTVGEPLMKLPKNMIQPRIGFAWNFLGDDKTVLRGGFGIFHDQLWMNLYGNTRQLFPFAASISQLFPVFLDPLQGRETTVGTQPGGTHMQYLAEAPYVMQFNLQLQREIARNTVLKLSYIGSQGRHLVSSGRANVAEFELLPNGKPFWAVPNGPRVNPNFGSTSCQCQAWNSSYNAAQIEIERRFSAGFRFQTHYTWARPIDDISGPFSSDFNNDPGTPHFLFNTTLDRGLSSFEVQHKWVSNWTWEVPIGPGRRFGADMSGAAASILGDWNISGILTTYGGYAFTVRNAFDRAGQRGNHNRPNQISPIVMTRTVEEWFDPRAFELNDVGTLGNVGRNHLIGPTLTNMDITLTKDFRIGEDKAIQFRAEFFNLLDNANFEAPLNTQDAVGTGGDGESIFASASGQILPTAGRIFRTVTNAREIQFALKFIF